MLQRMPKAQAAKPRWAWYIWIATMKSLESNCIFLSLSDVTPPITWSEDSCQRILERVVSENWGCAIHSAQQDCNQQTRHGSECSWQLCRQKGVTFEAQISWHHLWVESQLRGLQQGSSFNGFSPVHHFVDMQPEPDSTLLGWILRFGSTNIPDDDLTSCSHHKQSFEVRASSHRISIRDGALLHQNCPG